MRSSRHSASLAAVIELKSFYRCMEQCFAAASAAKTPGRFAAQLAPALLEELSGPLGVSAVHAYERANGAFARTGQWGPARPDLADAITRADRPGAEHREPPWVLDSAAGIAGALRVGGDEGPIVVLFGPEPDGLARPVPRSDFASALHSLQYAVRQHHQRQALRNVMDQARVIQQSLLPAGRAPFEGFDLYAASVPAADVGGDLYDWLPLDRETIAIAVADASGHGLPAALQARDVAMGVRMGVARELKVTRLVEKLNRIIHRSGLVTRFVSLFLGELESNGNLVYVNAGHPSGLLLDDHGLHELGVGGPILGPLPDAVYKLGFAHVDRGAALALVSDGVLECPDGAGAHFGVERLGAWLEASRTRGAESSIADLFDRLRAHHGRESFEDDVTAMLVRRPRG